MPKVTIKSLQERIDTQVELLNKGRDHANWQRSEIEKLKYELANLKGHLDRIHKDKEWLQRLCAEQSSSIAGYMRSR